MVWLCVVTSVHNTPTHAHHNAHSHTPSNQAHPHTPSGPPRPPPFIAMRPQSFVQVDLPGALVRLWRGQESPEDAMLRFTLELEFVQCLSNPFYLKCAS